MTAIMKSVSPRICEKVANGDCTILVSKTAPKCDVPFKCYIYATKKKHLIAIFKKGEHIFSDDHSFGKFDENIFVKDNHRWQGKVVGECIIDKIDEIVPDYNPATAKFYYGYVVDTAATCLSEEELQKYGKNKSLYFWHISDLKIYGNPKELGEFKTPPCEKSEKACGNCKWLIKRNTPDVYECECYVEDGRPITRAPQSWQYVEEV